MAGYQHCLWDLPAPALPLCFPSNSILHMATWIIPLGCTKIMSFFGLKLIVITIKLPSFFTWIFGVFLLLFLFCFILFFYIVSQLSAPFLQLSSPSLLSLHFHSPSWGPLSSLWISGRLFTGPNISLDIEIASLFFFIKRETPWREALGHSTVLGTQTYKHLLH